MYSIFSRVTLVKLFLVKVPLSYMSGSTSSSDYSQSIELYIKLLFQVHEISLRVYNFATSLTCCSVLTFMTVPYNSHIWNHLFDFIFCFLLICCSKSSEESSLGHCSWYAGAFSKFRPHVISVCCTTKNPAIQLFLRCYSLPSKGFICHCLMHTSASPLI